MDKQQEQMKQSQPLTQASGSHKIQVTAEIGEPVKVHNKEKAVNLEVNQQDKLEGKEQPKKPKRSKKTLEQEIAELDAKRELLMEKKRKQEAHEKIVFGSTIMSMLVYLKRKDNNKFDVVYNIIDKFIDDTNLKDKEIINKILLNIK